MKVLFLSTNDSLGGAAMVTRRLAEALRAMGIDARMLVANRTGNEPWIATVSPLRFKAAKIAERGEIFINNGFNLPHLWKVSTARFGCGITSHPWIAEADIIVPCWINQGLLSLADIEALCRLGKPIVWWMHDLWCATGICHLPGGCTNYEVGCGNCPMMHRFAHETDLSRRIWRRKLTILSNSSLKFLAVSNWQRNIARRSALISSCDIDVLPHAFPVEDYAFELTTAPLFRAPEQKLIVMGAARLDDAVKNLPMAITSLNCFKHQHPDIAANCRVAFFGNIRNKQLLDNLELPYTHLGLIPADQLKQLYAEASVVLSTSQFETMGATLMEGMAAGAIPVTFNNGGQGDIVTHGVNGYIANYNSAVSVAECLAKALTPTPPFSRLNQHNSVAQRFSAQAIASRFLSLLKP